MSATQTVAAKDDAFFSATLAEADPEIAASIRNELGRQHILEGCREQIVVCVPDNFNRHELPEREIGRFNINATVNVRCIPFPPRHEMFASRLERVGAAPDQTVFP